MSSSYSNRTASRWSTAILIGLMIVLIGALGLVGCSDNPVSAPSDESMTTESEYNVDRSLDALATADSLSNNQNLK